MSDTSKEETKEVLQVEQEHDLLFEDDVFLEEFFRTEEHMEVSLSDLNSFQHQWECDSSMEDTTEFSLQYSSSSPASQESFIHTSEEDDVESIYEPVQEEDFTDTMKSMWNATYEEVDGEEDFMEYLVLVTKEDDIEKSEILDKFFVRYAMCEIDQEKKRKHMTQMDLSLILLT